MVIWQSEPDFNIEFPTVSNVLKSEIQYKLNDKDVQHKLFIYYPQGVFKFWKE
jgi:hypothetical protein